MTRAVTIAELGDQNTFVVDGNNQRVGIASANPTTTLDVGGTVTATSFVGDGTGLTGVAATDNIITGTAATFTGGVTISGASNVNVTGVITATSFSGDATGLTGIAATDNIITGTAATFTGGVNISGASNINVSGVITATSFVGDATGLSGTPDITVRNVTGVAATFAGVLTYEDVTNVDSIGIITARSGINLTGGRYTNGVNAMGALDVNMSLGNYFTKTITTGINTFTFSNPPSSGTVGSFTLELTQTGGTADWPTEVKWPEDTAPTLSTGKTHLFVFITDDGGSRYRGAALANYVN